MRKRAKNKTAPALATVPEAKAESLQDAVVPHAAGSLIRVYVQPRASVDEVVGLHDGRLKIRVASPPVDGQANAAICCFLGKRLGVNQRNVQLVRGQTGRRKDIAVSKLSPDQVRKKLSP